jgi:hypothetical protein
LSKQKKHIDDLFKDHLGDAELPLAGGEWDAIFSELHGKKKKRFAWWIYILGAGIFLFGAWYAYTTITNPKKGKVLAEIITPTLDNITSTDDSIAQDANATAQTENSKKANLDSATKKTRSVKLEQAKTSKPNVVKTNRASDRATRDKPPLANKGNDADRMDSPNLQSISSDIGTNSKSIDKPTIMPLPSLSRISNLEIYDFDKNNIPVIVKNALFYPSLQLAAGPIQSETAKLPKLQIGMKMVGITNNQIVSVNASGPQKYVNYKNMNESKRVTTSIEMLARVNWKSMNLSSGISYMQRGQDLNDLGDGYEITYQIYDSIPYRNTTGDTIGFLPFNYRDTTNFGDIDRPTYSYVGIPLSFGHTIYLGSRWSIDGAVNTSFNFLVGTKGNTLSNQAKPVALEPKSLNKFLMNAGLTVGVNYSMTDNLMIHLDGNVSRDITSMIKYPNASQHMRTSGLGIGVFYTVNRF